MALTELLLDAAPLPLPLLLLEALGVRGTDALPTIVDDAVMLVLTLPVNEELGALEAEDSGLADELTEKEEVAVVESDTKEGVEPMVEETTCDAEALLDKLLLPLRDGVEPAVKLARLSEGIAVALAEKEVEGLAVLESERGCEPEPGSVGEGLPETLVLPLCEKEKPGDMLAR